MATSHSKPGEHQEHASGWHEIQGHRLYWERYGAAESEETILLLHHGLGSTRAWRRQIPALTGQGWQVIAYDRWGYGRSDPRPAFEPHFLRHDAQEALQVMDALQVKTASLVGHSDGGSIAIIMAAQAPERILRMVLIAAHIYVEPKMAQGLRGIQQAAKVNPLRKALQREHGSRAGQILTAWITGWQRHGSQTLDLLPYLPLVRCPTLVIQGEEDEHATPQQAQDLAAGIQSSSLWLIPGVAHMPMHERPQAFNQRLIAFLQSKEDSHV